jgi:hypothetical protein
MDQPASIRKRGSVDFFLNDTGWRSVSMRMPIEGSKPLVKETTANHHLKFCLANSESNEPVTMLSGQNDVI